MNSKSTFNKLFLLVLLLIQSFGIYASQKSTVVCTHSILYDIAKEINQGKCELVCLIPVGGDPHLYDPIPNDVKQIAEASLLVKNGLHLEGWLDKVIQNSGTKALIIEASDGVQPIQSVDHENSYDPHAWMDIDNAILYAMNIKNALSEIDPENEVYYQNNFLKYTKELKALDAWIQNQINSIPEAQRILITSHDAFQYFSKAYGIRVEAALGISTEAEVQMSDLNKLISLIKKQEIPAIFVESTINPKLLQELANDLGVVIGGELFADSLSDPEDEAETYKGMMKHNVENIVKALSKKHIYQAQEVNYLFILITAIILLMIVFWTSKKLYPHKEKDLAEKFHLKVRDLSVSYQNKTILSNLHFKLGNGALIGIIGANGSGKSTLLKAILGLVKKDNGTCEIDGYDLNSYSSKIAYIPQKDEIDLHFPVSVMDVVLMGRNPHKKFGSSYSQEDCNKAEEAIEKLGLENIKNKQIGEISGGQLQRVFIARAVCQEAQIYLLDEPFVGVDMLTEEKIINLLKSFVKEGKMILLIHHDLSKVRDYFDELMMINQRIVALGGVEEVFTEQNIENTFGAQLPILHLKDEFR